MMNGSTIKPLMPVTTFQNNSDLMKCECRIKNSNGDLELFEILFINNKHPKLNEIMLSAIVNKVSEKYYGCLMNSKTKARIKNEIEEQFNLWSQNG